jgi:single-strand DNA-binding protein
MKKTVIIGNLGQDAQVKATQQGTQYLSFSVAVTEKRKGQETTTWFSCSGWGERFVTSQLGQYLKKGTKVYIEGNYTPSLFQRQDGTTDISHNLMVDQIELLGGAPQQAAPAAQNFGQDQQPAMQTRTAPAAQPVQSPTYAQPMQNTSDKLQQFGTPGSGHSDDQDLPF